MGSVTYDKCNYWQTYYGKCNYSKCIYDKSIMANGIERVLAHYSIVGLILKVKMKSKEKMLSKLTQWLGLYLHRGTL